MSGRLHLQLIFQVLQKEEVYFWGGKIKFRIGEGLSFLYSKAKIQQGLPTRLPPDFTGFAVIFDSSQAGKTSSHAVKLITSGETSQSQSVIGGCSADFRNHKVPYHVRVVYKNQTVTGMKKIYYLLLFICFYLFSIHVYIPRKTCLENFWRRW
jgi:hypothetical protein